MSDGVDDVPEIIERQVEERFHMSLHELGPAIAAAPDEHRDAREFMYFYGLLAVAQSEVERSEEDLLAALGDAPGELTDAQMDLAHRVNAAVAARDDRAMTVQYLLKPESAGPRGTGAWRGPAQAASRLPTSSSGLPPRPAGTSSSETRGRSR